MAKKNQHATTANTTTATLGAKPTPVVVESKPTAQPVAHTTTKAAKNVTHEEIAKAAYNRWLKFGGDEKSNWIAAERELRGS